MTLNTLPLQEHCANLLSLERVFRSEAEQCREDGQTAAAKMREQRADELAAAADAIAALLTRIEAAKRVIAFGYRRVVEDGRTVDPLKNGELCAHGRQEFEDCIGCYDEALTAALDGESNV